MQKVTGAYTSFLAEKTPYLLDLVKKAGARILDFYQKNNLDIKLKSDASPVTLADKQANSILCEGLKKFGLPIISEEGQIQNWQKRKNYKGVWILDPLDGTRAFIKGEGEFTVNLAFIENSVALYGIIYAPVLDEICWTFNDKVFWQKDTQTKELKVGASAKIPRIFVSRTSSDNTETREFLQKIGDYELVKTSSSWKFCELAKNNADIYPRFGTTCEWDIAAGDAILAKMGGKIVDATSGEKLTYNKEDLTNPFFIASF